MAKVAPSREGAITRTWLQGSSTIPVDKPASGSTDNPVHAAAKLAFSRIAQNSGCRQHTEFGIGHATVQFETAETAQRCELRSDHVV